MLTPQNNISSGPRREGIQKHLKEVGLFHDLLKAHPPSFRASRISKSYYFRRYLAYLTVIVAKTLLSSIITELYLLDSFRKKGLYNFVVICFIFY
jgi:hypothetical protein